MHESRYPFVLACLALFALGTSAAWCADDLDASSPEHRAIRAAAKAYQAAMRRGDAEALSKMWTPEGDYVDAAGRVFNARDLIRERFAEATPEVDSAEPPEQEISLRLVTPDVAIEDGTGDFGAASDGSVVAGRFTAVWVKRDGQWLLDCLREGAAKAPSAEDHLEPLGWLIGEWVGTTDATSMLVSARWSEGGNFIVREFLVHSDGREVLSGSQRIGWDPAARKIKSWTFDSHGGAGEGYWRRDGERWIVDSEEVMPNGEIATASVVITPDGDDRFEWNVKSATVDGQDLPSIRVDFKRAAEDE